MERREPWHVASDGLLLSVRVTPRGGRDAIEGVADLADGTRVLKVRLRAPPSEGQANAALVRFLAEALGVATREVSLLGGAQGRIKRLKITGAGAALAATLQRLCHS